MIRLTLGTTGQWGGKLRELSVQHNRDDILIVDWAGTEVVSGGQKLGSVLGGLLPAYSVRPSTTRRPLRIRDAGCTGGGGRSARGWQAIV